MIGNMNIIFSKNNMKIYHNYYLLFIWHTQDLKKEKKKKKT
jgi:hypothetical protein